MQLAARDRPAAAVAMAHKHLGQDFLPPDVVAKVTGEAKYAEDFRAEGMVFARLLNSPYPHARVRSIDASEALKMPGVVGILTPDEITNPPAPDPQLLCSEPGYVGAPVLLLAAESETQAQDAIDKVRIDWEVLPFHVDPLQSLHPDRPDARAETNVGAKNIEPQKIKWTARTSTPRARHACRWASPAPNGPTARWTRTSRAASW
jgi:xanthine dehydrogenase molybdenum-binding subunit